MALIVAGTAIGTAMAFTAFLSLAITLPLPGHASWHAPRDLVSDDT